MYMKVYINNGGIKVREIKELDITIPKCDYLAIPFSYKRNGENVQLGENDLIFFSVKKYKNDKNYIFQKTLENGITFDSVNTKYLIEINYEDTKDVEIGDKLLYDIVIYYDGKKPVQKVVGTLEIGLKLTMNEVV